MKTFPDTKKINNIFLAFKLIVNMFFNPLTASIFIYFGLMSSLFSLMPAYLLYLAILFILFHKKYSKKKLLFLDIVASGATSALAFLLFVKIAADFLFYYLYRIDTYNINTIYFILLSAFFTAGFMIRDIARLTITIVKNKSDAKTEKEENDLYGRYKFCFKEINIYFFVFLAVAVFSVFIKGYICVIGFGLLATFFAYFFIMDIFGLRRANRLLEGGAAVSAKILYVATITYKGRPNNYFIETLGGKVYYTSHFFGESPPVKRGDAVTVYINPKNPKDYFVDTRDIQIRMGRKKFVLN